ncbi:DegQ family serine endoprotease [Luteithermobacter gelatinilyticus]|mgnify:CR=1 FL=1|uniref:DegQ family serine endoprotease n=1 Tax=Luteithermobacter gelatinilyticus TaxID=2582913 RepID=UPI0011058571|nr:DegQ family serine endoprotease [Luteithermobacter gelatinilyticus]
MSSIRHIFMGALVVVLTAAAIPATVFAKEAPASFADLAEKLLPAVVNVYTKQTINIDRDRGFPGFPPGSPFEEFFKRFEDRNNGDEDGRRPRTRQRMSLGSGFIISSEGIIVTNNHVIEDADEVSVRMHDGTEYDAEIVGKDTKVDLAVLRVKAKKPLPYVTFGDDTKSRVGDWVVAIGNPYGLGGTVTAGIISARNRDINSGPYDDYLQTDASINRGNSGGPMFNMDGEVIGINTAIYSPSGGNIGIGFAVPSSQAKRVIDQILEYGHVRRGWLGVTIQAVTEEIAESLGLDEARGALVSTVNNGSPADDAGIESGDIILEFDGKDVEEMRELPRLVADTEIGKTVKVKVLRKGKIKTLKVTIAELKEDDEVAVPSKLDKKKDQGPEKSLLGMTLENLDRETREALNLDEDFQGVVITHVERYSPSSERGLRRGDVIVEITQVEVSTVEEARKRIEELRAMGRKSILLKVYRRGSYSHVAVSFDEEEEQ